MVWATVGLGTPIWAAAPPAGRRRRPAGRGPGTINIVAYVPVRLGDAALVNAVATVTEAKAQALTGARAAATGTATDAVSCSARRTGRPSRTAGRARRGAPGWPGRCTRRCSTGGAGVTSVGAALVGAAVADSRRRLCQRLAGAVACRGRCTPTIGPAAPRPTSRAGRPRSSVRPALPLARAASGRRRSARGRRRADTPQWRAAPRPARPRRPPTVAAGARAATERAGHLAVGHRRHHHGQRARPAAGRRRQGLLRRGQAGARRRPGDGQPGGAAHRRHRAPASAAAQRPSRSCHQFRAPPAYAAHLRDAGFELLNQANNHGNDYGPAGLPQHPEGAGGARPASTPARRTRSPSSRSRASRSPWSASPRTPGPTA